MYKKGNLYYVICLLTTLSLAAGNVLMFKSNVIAFIILASTAFLIYRPEYLVPQMFLTFLLPDSCMVFAISAQRFYTVTFLTVMWIRLLKRRSFGVISKIQVILLLMMLYILLQTIRLNTITVDFNILFMNMFVAYFMPLLNTDHIRDVMSIILQGCFLSILMLLYNYLFTAEVNEITSAFFLIADTNENRVGMALQQIGAAVFSMGIIYYMYRNRKMTVLCFMLALLTFILLLADGSRSALVGLAAACGVGVLYFIRGKDADVKKRMSRLAVIVIVLSVSYICFIIFIGVNGNIAYRYDFKRLIMTGGTHRLEIWTALWRTVMREYPLYGIGFSAQEIIRILRENGLKFSGTHNLILDILFKLGPIGLTVFILLCASVYIKGRKRLIQGNYALLFPLLLFVGFIFNGVGENIFYERGLWMAIGICLWMSKGTGISDRMPDMAYETGQGTGRVNQWGV